MKLCVAVVMFVVVPFVFADDVVWRVAPPFSLMPGGNGPEGSEAAKKQMPHDTKENTAPKHHQEQPKPAALNTDQNATSNQDPGHESKRHVDPDEQTPEWFASPLILFLLAATAAIFAGYQAFYSKKAVTLAEQSMADIARASLIEQQKERAYLSVARCKLDDRFIRRARSTVTIVRCYIVNAGRTTGTIIATYCNYCLSARLPDAPDYTQISNLWEGREIVQTGHEFLQSMNVLGLGATERKALQNKSLALYFYGRLVYEDVFQERHLVVFFMQYDVNHRLFLAVPAQGYNYND